MQCARSIRNYNVSCSCYSNGKHYRKDSLFNKCWAPQTQLKYPTLSPRHRVTDNLAWLRGHAAGPRWADQHFKLSAGQSLGNGFIYFAPSTGLGLSITSSTHSGSFTLSAVSMLMRTTPRTEPGHPTSHPSTRSIQAKPPTPRFQQCAPKDAQEMDANQSASRPSQGYEVPHR